MWGAPHAGHVEEVLERVGGAEELCEGCPGVPVEGVAEVGAAHVAVPAPRPACTHRHHVTIRTFLKLNTFLNLYINRKNFKMNVNIL